MALTKISEVADASGSASHTLTGIDSTYDVYLLNLVNVAPVNDDKNLIIRFTVSGTPDTSANYKFAFKYMQATTSYFNSTGTNIQFDFAPSVGNATGETVNGNFILYNFANSSEYSYANHHFVYQQFNDVPVGVVGGFALTENQATDGVHFFWESGNFLSGKIRLYGIK